MVSWTRKSKDEVEEHGGWAEVSLDHKLRIDMHGGEEKVGRDEVRGGGLKEVEGSTCVVGFLSDLEVLEDEFGVGLLRVCFM